MRTTCAFCGPMAMISDRLSARPALKAGEREKGSAIDMAVTPLALQSTQRHQLPVCRLAA